VFQPFLRLSLSGIEIRVKGVAGSRGRFNLCCVGKPFVAVMIGSDEVEVGDVSHGQECIESVSASGKEKT
jgi:hypothetical protein